MTTSQLPSRQTDGLLPSAHASVFSARQVDVVGELRAPAASFRRDLQGRGHVSRAGGQPSHREVTLQTVSALLTVV